MEKKNKLYKTENELYESIERNFNFNLRNLELDELRTLVLLISELVKNQIDKMSNNKNATVVGRLF